MSWLKKFGEKVLQGAGIAAVIAGGPIGTMAAALIPGTKDDRWIAKGIDSLATMAEVIKNLEVAGQSLSLSGADKLKGAIPSISNAVMLSAIMGGLPPGNKAEYDAGVIDLTNAIVRIMNSRSD